jgi:dienelactone hydrolase
MKILGAAVVFTLSIMIAGNVESQAEPIYHETSYPNGDGPFPVVIVLHTSGGFMTVKKQIAKYTNSGYAVYAPDFFRRHGITHHNRFKTWTTYRAQIEAELLEIIDVIDDDTKADEKNIFAVGFSNGGYWASFLAARKHVNAGVSHYGVWSWPKSNGWNGYPANYFDSDSNPALAIHGKKDSIQKPRFVYPQLKAVERKSPRFKKHIFRNAGHSWDCKPCRKDGYDENVSQQALTMTLEFFAANKQ